LTSAHQWQKTFSEPASAPEIIAGDPEVYDGYDGFLDPGETADLLIQVHNLGSLYTDNLDLQITTSDQYVTLLSEPLQTIDHLPHFHQPV